MAKYIVHNRRRRRPRAIKFRSVQVAPNVFATMPVTEAELDKSLKFLAGTTRHWKSGEWVKQASGAWKKVSKHTIRYALAASVIASLSGCAKEHRYEVDPEFRGYLSEFMDLLKQHPKATHFRSSVTIVFGQTKPEFWAYCHAEDGVVVVRPDIWKDLPEKYRRSLIFHELGHCILGRDHDLTIEPAHGNSPTRPRSIMHPDTAQAAPFMDPSDRRVMEEFDEYIEELFSR